MSVSHHNKILSSMVEGVARRTLNKSGSSKGVNSAKVHEIITDEGLKLVKVEKVSGPKHVRFVMSSSKDADKLFDLLEGQVSSDKIALDGKAVEIILSL